MRIHSIDGQEPMAWLISVAKGSLLPLPYKVCGCFIEACWVFFPLDLSTLKIS